MKSISEFITRRAVKLVTPLRNVLPPRFHLAGGCFGPVVNDLDLFPVDFDKLAIEARDDVTKVVETKNAETWKVFGKTVQLCSYRHQSLRSLVESFDFAHIQIGASVSITDGVVEVDDTYCSNLCQTARVMGDSFYTGSEYPLSSMVRLAKYFKRECISRGSMIESVIAIMADVAERGFEDYEDFKDQMDAVDLGLLPEAMNDIQLESCRRLFDGLTKGDK